MVADFSGYLKALPWGAKALLAFGLFALTLVASLGAVAAVLVRLPADYFRDGCSSPAAGRHPVARWVGMVVKNVAGLLLVVLGLLLSLPGIPGQGLLTILIGVMLLDFPGKRRVERRLVSRPRVLAGINALRIRFGRAPLRLG